MSVARRDSVPPLHSQHLSRSNSSDSSSSGSSSESITYGRPTPPLTSQPVDDELLVRLVQASPTQDEESRYRRKSLIIQNFNNKHSSFGLPPPVASDITAPTSRRTSFQQNKIVRTLNNIYKNSISSTTLSGPVAPSLATAALFFRSLSPTNDETVQKLAHKHSIAHLRHSFPLSASASQLSLRSVAKNSNRRANSARALTMYKSTGEKKPTTTDSKALPPAPNSYEAPPQPPTHLTSSSLSSQGHKFSTSNPSENDSSPPPVQSSIPRPTPVKRKTRVSDLFSRLSASSTASSRAKAELKSSSSAKALEPSVSKIPTSNGASNIPSSKARSTFFKSRHSTGNLTSTKPLPSSPPVGGSKRRATNAVQPSIQRLSQSSVTSITPSIQSTQLAKPDELRSSPPPPAIPSQMVSKGMRINPTPATGSNATPFPASGPTRPFKPYSTTFNTSSHLSNQPISVTTATVSLPGHSATSKPRSARNFSSPSGTSNTTVTAPGARSHRINSAGSYMSPTSTVRLPHATAIASLTSANSNTTTSLTLSSTQSPLVNRRQSDGYGSPAINGRPTSRLKTHRRPGSRASMGSITSRAQNSFKVEDLKSKINELEEVLLQEKVERETVYSRVSRINSLEIALDRERSEKMQLLSRLKSYEGGSTATFVALQGEEGSNRNSSHSESSIVSLNKETSGDDSLSDRATMVGSPSVDDWRRMIRNTEFKTDALESKISALELEIENRDLQLAARDEDTFGYQILEFQNVITELKLGKETLRNENESLRNDLRKYKESIRTIKTRSQTLERKLSGKKTKLEVSENQLALIQEKLNRSSEEIEAKNRLLNHKARELEDMRARVKSTESHRLESEAQLVRATQQIDIYRVELEHVHTECEQVQAKAQHERWQSEKQVTALERDNRRGKRIIAALETSLQDLKISLEEKAMENDELNRSIQKVMEQANETIEGAKRHSLYIASPVMSPRPMSSPPNSAQAHIQQRRPASANNILPPHRRTHSMRNSLGGYAPSTSPDSNAYHLRNTLNSLQTAVQRRSYTESQSLVPLNLTN